MMRGDRIHPTEATTESPESPRSTTSSIPSYVAKSGEYVIQLPKDQIYRVPPPENAAKFKAYTRRSSSSPRRRCCCRLLCFLLSLILLVCAAAAILYLVFNPKLPSYSIQSLAIHNLNLSSSAAGAAISPEFDVTISASNPNTKIGIDYRGGSDVTVFYNGLTLSDGSWPQFYQRPRNVTVFGLVLRGSGVMLSSEENRSLVADEKEGSVPLDVQFRVPIRIKFGSVTTWTIYYKVECDVTVNKMKPDAAIVSRKCHTKFHV